MGALREEHTVARIKVVTTDYVEPDLAWEAEQYAQLGVAFSAHQLKFASPAELLQVAADADVLIVNMAKFNAEVIQGLRRCKLIIRHGIGYDNVDVAAATRCKIMVANIPDYCVHEVAEQTVMLIMACQRKLPLQSRVARNPLANGTWDFLSVAPIYSVLGKAVGIVGFGRIGSTVFRMMQGFGVSFLICDPYISEMRKQQFGIETVPLERLLREADIITVHTPLTDETYHMFDESQFQLMKPTSVLVNTARGGVVNLRALDQALREGLIAQAGIDVYEEREPPEPDFPLLHNERAICTPHLSWMAEEASWNIREKIVEDVRRFVRGQIPTHQVNPEVQILA
jgi:D-3-phosphoglycerate dehydrogenase